MADHAARLLARLRDVLTDKKVPTAMIEHMLKADTGGDWASPPRTIS